MAINRIVGKNISQDFNLLSIMISYSVKSARHQNVTLGVMWEFGGGHKPQFNIATTQYGAA
jgi:hypothetical protein